MKAISYYILGHTRINKQTNHSGSFSQKLYRYITISLKYTMIPNHRNHDSIIPNFILHPSTQTQTSDTIIYFIFNYHYSYSQCNHIRSHLLML